MKIGLGKEGSRKKSRKKGGGEKKILQRKNAGLKRWGLLVPGRGGKGSPGG